jgi:hypothetical protein
MTRPVSVGHAAGFALAQGALTQIVLHEFGLDR